MEKECNICGAQAVIVSGENTFCDDCYKKRRKQAKFERDKHVLEICPPLADGTFEGKATAVRGAGVSSENYDKIVKKDFELIWEGDLDDYEEEDKEWIIENLIPSRSVGVWTGKRGTFKTFLVLSAIFSVSSGKDFLGRFPTNKGKVIYLDKENGIPIMRQRKNMIKKGMGLEERLPVGFICFSTLKIDNDSDIKKIEDLIREHSPSLLIVDTYRRGISFEENDAGKVSNLFVEVLRPLVEKYNLSIILIHHDRKGQSQGDEMDMIRGSSDLANYADFILKNERKGKNLLLKQLKMRCSAEMDNPINIQIKTDEITNISFVSTGDYEVMTKDKKCTEILTVWIMKNNLEEFKTSEAMNVAFQEGIKKVNFYSALQMMTDNGLITKEGHGNYKVSRDAKLIV